MSAAGIIVLILFLVGIGVAIYYACLCLQPRSKRPLKYSTNDDGPLLAPDPDLNGNLENSPLEAVRSSDESDPPKLPPAKANPPTKETHVESPPPNPIQPQTTPECASKNPVRGSDPVILDIEGKGSPRSPRRDELLTRKSPDARPELVSAPPLRDPVSEGDLEDGLYVPRSPPPLVMMMGPDLYTANAQPPLMMTQKQPAPTHQPPIMPPQNVILPPQGAERMQQLPYSLHPQHAKQMHPIRDPPKTRSPQKPADAANKRVHFVPVACATALSCDSPLPEVPVEKAQDPPYPVEPCNAYTSPGQPINLNSSGFVPSAPIDEDHTPTVRDGIPPLGWSEEVDSAKEDATPAYEVNFIDISKKEESEKAIHPSTEPNKDQGDADDAPLDTNKEEKVPENTNSTVDSPTKSESGDDLKETPVTKDENKPSTPDEDSSDTISTDTSDPDVTEYSFIPGDVDPSTSTVIANEIGCGMDPTVTSYINVPENEDGGETQAKQGLSAHEQLVASLQESQILSQGSADEKSANNKANILTPIDCDSLGTPPNTPPEKVSSTDLIINNSAVELPGHQPATPPPEVEQSPTFIVIETHNPKKRRSRSSTSSSCSSSSSSSTSSTSSSEGSFHPNSSYIMDKPAPPLPSEKSKIPVLKK